MLTLFTTSLLAAGGNRDIPDSPEAAGGVIDLRNWDFYTSGPIKLEGEWLFRWNEHLSPGSTYDETIESAVNINMPGYWNDLMIDEKQITGRGFATYYLKILLPEIDDTLSLNIANVQSSYTLYLNGKETAGVGIPGKTRQTTTPDYSSVTVSHYTEGETVEILIHVSNFQHREGGMWEPVRFGLEKDINDNFLKRRMMDIFTASCIITMAIYHLSLFLYRRKDKASYYFGLFCLIIAIRALLTGTLTAYQLFPDVPWTIFLRIEYITFYSGFPLFLLYLISIFPGKLFSDLLVKVFIALGAVFCLTVIFAPVWIFTRTLKIYQFITLFGGIYSIYILIRAIINKQEGSFLLLGGFIVMFLTTINDILYTNEFISTGLFMPIGLLVFLMSQAVLLTRRSGLLFDKIEKQAVELKKTNLALNSEVHERRKLESNLIESYKQLEQSKEGIILGLAKLAEYRDEDTGSHLERIREYCKVLAERLSEHPDYSNYISSEYITDIYKSSILHDIGKVGIPDNILLKPGKLTAEEFEIIKRHPLIGGDAIRNVEQTIHIQSFLTLGKEIAYYHHEKWDGSGYPEGLSERDIPLSARIVALADVYDALSSERPYKRAFTEEETIKIITNGRGCHFDPDIVDAFLKSRSDFLSIRNRYEDK